MCFAPNDFHLIEDLSSSIPVPALCVFGKPNIINLARHMVPLVRTEESLTVISKVHCPAYLNPLTALKTKKVTHC